MKKLIVLSVFLGLINTPVQALHRTSIYLKNNTSMTNPIWAYLPYRTGAFTSTASVPSDVPVTSWGTDSATASGSTSIASGATGTITSGNYDVSTYQLRVRIKTNTGDEVSFSSMMSYGNSLFGTSQYPIKFPGEWIEGDYTTPDKIASLATLDPSKPFGLPMAIKKTFNDGKVYSFISQFIYNKDDTNSKYTTTNWSTNWLSLLADLTIPPVAPTPPTANIDNASVQQQLNASAPPILQSGFFNIITNKTAADYQIRNKVGTGAKIGLSGNGASTNVSTLLGTDSYFNTLWIVPTLSAPNPADKSQNPYIIIEPKNDQTYPTFTFTFDETASSPQITVKRGAVGAASEDSWIIYLNPIINGLKIAFLPLPQQWSFDITIDENWNIIINTWNSTSNTYVVAKDSSTDITNHKFIFNAKETTYSTVVNMTQPTSQTTPSGLQGGLCGLQVLESNNPTCTASK